MLEGVLRKAEEAWEGGRPEVIGVDVEWRPALYSYYDEKSAAAAAAAVEGEGGGADVDKDGELVSH